MTRKTSAAVHAVAVFLLSASLGFAAAQEVKPAKPRVKPQQTITVKLYPEPHYRAKAGAAPYYISTVSETGCTAWLPVSKGTSLDDELAAYKACRRALFDLHKVP